MFSQVASMIYTPLTTLQLESTVETTVHTPTPQEMEAFLLLNDWHYDEELSRYDAGWYKTYHEVLFYNSHYTLEEAYKIETSPPIT